MRLENFILPLMLCGLMPEALALGPEFYGLLDTYYAQDINAADDKKRSFTTQPLHHDTFGINLAMLGMKVEKGRKRGVFALQFGDSVDINYMAEPKEGEGIKHIQEAYAGIQLSNGVWVDAGIYLGHIGNESWISNQNWTYTRSLLSDNVPYYATGVRFSGKHGKNDWQFHLMNGWQTISETNSGKAIGTQYIWNLNGYSIAYNTQIGHELFPGRQTSGLRTYQNLQWEVPGNMIDWKMAVDIGTQNVPGEKRALVWGVTSSQWRWRYSELWNFAGRLEYFHDAEGALVTTTGQKGFKVIGASVNADHKIEQGVLLRLELRHLQAAEEIYPDKGTFGKSDTFIVGSLSLEF